VTPQGDVAILTQRPGTSFAFEGIPPPSRVYIDRDDTLRITSITGYALLSPLLVTLRILMPDGQLSINQFAHTTAATRLAVVTGQDLTEGFLLSVTVSALPTTVPARSVFVQVDLVKGNFFAGIIGETLISGYLTGRQAIGWPEFPAYSSVQDYGQRRLITGTDPAAGVEITETVPSGALWRLCSVYIQLTTSAVAGTRNVYLIFDDGATQFLRANVGGAGPTSTVNFYLAQNYPVQSVGAFTFAPLPLDLWLPSGYRFRTSTVTLDGGDNFVAPVYQVEEFLMGT